jgi:hypothetical protein
MRVTPPKYLYKYRAVDADALAMLASDKVYLSRLDAFNDPYEFLNGNNDVPPPTDRRERLTVEKASEKLDSDAVALRVCSQRGVSRPADVGSLWRPPSRVLYSI